jgi:hypothetical protein
MEKIDISRNSISELDAKLFQNKRQLALLDMSANTILRLDVNYCYVGLPHNIKDKYCCLA